MKTLWTPFLIYLILIVKVWLQKRRENYKDYLDEESTIPGDFRVVYGANVPSPSRREGG